MFEAKEHFVRTPPLVALALLWGLPAPIAARAEIVSVAPVTPPSSAETPPPPTVLRGFPPSPPKRGPICPPGYALSSEYGCVAPTPAEYAEGWAGYDYWPDYWYGYPGYGYGASRSPRFRGFRGFHHPVGFVGRGIGVAHIGGFGRR